MDENYDISNPEIFGDPAGPAIIKAIGVGGGGGNAINYMYKQNIPNVTFAICNTDQQALKISPVPDKIVLGYEITKGLGAGNNPEVGRQCAEASTEEIKKLLQDGTEMVFITAGMGGGTGTGAAPVVAKIAKEAGMLTIGIVTIPFLFEGERKIIKALDGAEELKKYVDALLVINNERLTEIYSDLDFFNAFGKADDTLANAARSISEIISEPCIINVDFQDVKTTLRDSGAAIISTGYGEGENRVAQAINNALNSPLLKSHDINTSKRLLFKLSYNPKMKEPFKTVEINQLTQFMNNLSPSIDVKWGYSHNETLGEKVKMTILASGFDITLRDGGKKENKIILESKTPPTQTPDPAKDSEATDRMMALYGKEAIKKHGQAKAKVKYVVLRPDQFDDDEVISKIENTPAFNRDPHFNNELRRQPAAEPSRPLPAEGRPNTEDQGASPILFS